MSPAAFSEPSAGWALEGALSSPAAGASSTPRAFNVDTVEKRQVFNLHLLMISAILLFMLRSNVSLYFSIFSVMYASVSGSFKNMEAVRGLNQAAYLIFIKR